MPKSNPKVRRVKVEVQKVWVIVDIQKKNPRLCYASPKEKNDKDSVGFLAVTIKKPWIHWNWRPFKKIARATITYSLPKPPKKTE